MLINTKLYIKMTEILKKYCKKFTILSLFLFISSCNCHIPLRVTAIQQHDKSLSCKEIILAINETEHLMQEARKSKSIAFDEILMPLCWMSKYSSSRESIDSIKSRIRYLKDTFSVQGCDDQSNLDIDKPAEKQFYNRNNATPMPQMLLAPNGAILNPMMIPNPNIAPPRAATPNVQFPANSPSPTGFRSLKSENDPWLHEHVLPNGKIYRHSHPNKGPHRHLEY